MIYLVLLIGTFVARYISYWNLLELSRDDIWHNLYQQCLPLLLGVLLIMSIFIVILVHHTLMLLLSLAGLAFEFFEERIKMYVSF